MPISQWFVARSGGARFSRRGVLRRAAVLTAVLAGCAPRPSPTPSDDTPTDRPATPAVSPAATSEPGTPGVATPAPASPVAPASTPTPRDQPLRLTRGERSWQTSAQALSLTLPRPPVDLPEERVRVDAYLATLRPEVERAPRDARLQIRDDGAVVFTPAERGLELDVPTTRDRLFEAARAGHDAVEIALRPVEPARGDELFAAARAQLARILRPGENGALFTVKGGGKSWPLDRRETAELLAFATPTSPGDPARLTIDEPPVQAFAERLARALDEEPRNARFAWNGGRLKILREAHVGRALDQAATLKAFEEAILGADPTIELPLKPVAPAVPSDNPAALGIAGPIETGSTALAGAIPEKKWNIRLAAERLTGTVVPPGGIFSFNKEVGSTTIESGYKWGFGITSGSDGIKTIPSVAGGICQVATTLFQPVFWAGYQLEERYWHLYWIPAYASRGIVGLDVTVDEDARLDFKWVNPTPNHVLIEASADDEKITFTLYGTRPAWTIKVEPARITNRVPPDTTPVVEEEPTLPWGRSIVVEAAREGFDSEVVRRVQPIGGGEPRVLTLKSSYQPSRSVTLVGIAGKPPGAVVPGKTASQPPPENRPAGPPPPPPAAPTAAPPPVSPPAPTAASPATAPPEPAARSASPTSPTPPVPQPPTAEAAPATPGPVSPTPAPPSNSPPSPTPAPARAATPAWDGRPKAPGKPARSARGRTAD